ncbi:MAG: hypothetical protein QOG28_453 [Trebonia sp.]|jgi:hypothetical protein|nr:hypothetical protein [Actinomycetes bacterium]MDX6415833.1 hypothetical protein [Trebonia sp.]
MARLAAVTLVPVFRLSAGIALRYWTGYPPARVVHWARGAE